MADITVKEAAVLWDISDRRVRAMCTEGRIPGVIKEGRTYKIPADALKPIAERKLRGKQITTQYESFFRHIDAKKAELERRPLTQSELEN